MLRPEALLRLYAADVRERPVHEGLALLGIAMGVALVFAVVVANSSIAGSVEQLVGGITGKASLEVAARDTHGFPERLSEAVSNTPGVTVAAPLLEQRITVRGPAGERTVSLIGVTPILAALDGPVTQAFGRKGILLTRSLMLPSGVARAIGAHSDDVVTIGTGSRSVRVPVGLTFNEAVIGPLANSPVAVVPLDYAQELTGREGRVSRVLVRTSPGEMERVRASLSRNLGAILNVRPSDAEAKLIRQAAAPNDQSTTLFAAISAIVGFLFAVNAVLLTVPARRRLVRQHIVQGFSPGQLALMLAFEALVLGVGSSALGLVLGDLLSRHVFHSVPGYLSFAFPVGGQRVVSATTVSIAVATGIGASLLANAPAFRDIFRKRLSRGDADAAPRPAGPIAWAFPFAGCLLVGLTVVVVLLAPKATIVGVGALVAGMLLLLPALLRGLIELAWWLISRLGFDGHDDGEHAGYDEPGDDREPRAPDDPRPERRGFPFSLGRLVLAPLIVAVSEMRAKTARGTALAATIALAVFGSVAIEGAHGDLLRGLDGGAHGLTHSADVWIAPGGDVNTLTTMDFKRPARLDALRHVEGVANVRTYQGGFLDLADRRVWVIGRPAGDHIIIPAGQVIEGDAERAVRLIRAGGWIAVSDVIARSRDWSVGETVELPTPAGRSRFKVAALLTNVGWAPGTVILNQRDFQRAWLTSDPSAVEIDLEPGVTTAEAVPAIRSVVGRHTPLAVQTAGQRWDLMRDNARQGLGRLTQIATLVLIGAIVSTATATTATVWQRRKAIADSRVQGFGFWQLWSSLLSEAALLIGFGSAIGAAFGLGGQLLLSRWLKLTTGFPADYVPAVLLAVSAFAIVAAIALAVIAVPGYIAARTPMRVRFVEAEGAAS